MIWERTGTIAVTAGSAVVNGTGTAWATPTVKPGYILMTADLKLYEIDALNSSNQLTLSENYAGATNGSTTYVIIPTAGANVDLHARIEAFFERTRDLVNGGTDLLTATEAAYDAKLLEWEGEFDAAQSQRATDFTAAQDARASQFATDRAQQDLDIANAMNGLEGAPIAKAIPGGAVDICEIKGASILDLNGGWTQDMSKSWAKEDRVTTTYLGVHNTTASAWAVPGAAAGDWYWDGTNRNIYTLVGTAGATLSTLNRFGAAHFDARFAVAYSDRVILVDGDGVPWMVIERKSGSWTSGYISAGLVASIDFVSDTLLIGLDQDWGLRGIRFASDNGFAVSDDVGADRHWHDITTPISGRNGAITRSIKSGTFLVGGTVNAVAAMVRDNAPADPVTGLPVPTIGVATHGGLSFIHDDGTVTSRAPNQTNMECTAIEFIGNEGAYQYIHEWSAGHDARVMIVPADKLKDESTLWYHVNSTPSWETAILPWRQSPATFPNKLFQMSPEGDNAGEASGICGNVITCLRGMTRYWHNPANPAAGMVAYQAPDYVTPPMFGDVKAALLCERGAASLVGAELVTNGTFDTDSDWVKGTGWTISGGVATHTPGAGGDIYQTITCVAGETYVYQATVDATGDSSITNTAVQIRNSANSNSIVQVLSSDITPSGVTNVVLTFVATDTTHLVRVFSEDGVSVDGISVRRATPDRSVNGNGAVIHGNLSRDADGWVSGFSNNNYIEQPYNSDLDFGTGDFYAIVEVIQSTQAASQVLLSKAIPDGSNVFSMFTSAGTGHLGFYHPSAGSVSSGVIVPLNRSVQIGLVRQGGVVSFFIEGSIVHQTTPASFDLTAVGDDRLRIGRDFSVNSAAGTAIRGVAIGAGAPSAAQIRIMANWKGDVIEGTIHDTDYVESTQGLWVLTSAYLYEIGPDGAERSKQVNDIGATTLVAFHGGRLVS